MRSLLLFPPFLNSDHSYLKESSPVFSTTCIPPLPRPLAHPLIMKGGRVGLKVQMPPEKPCDQAIALKIAGA